MEESPPARRGQAVSVLAVLSGLGTGITVIAYPLIAPHWRWLFLVGGLGVLAAPLMWFRLPEGRAWLGAIGLNPTVEALSIQLLVILFALATYSVVRRNARLTRADKAAMKAAKG